MTRVTPITDNDVVLWKGCYNSQSQDVNSHAKIETIRNTIQNVEWSDAFVDTNDGLQCVYSVLQMNDKEENLNPTIFDVPDSTVTFCKLQHSWNGHAPQQNVLENSPKKARALIG